MSTPTASSVSPTEQTGAATSAVRSTNSAAGGGGGGATVSTATTTTTTTTSIPQRGAAASTSAAGAYHHPYNHPYHWPAPPHLSTPGPRTAPPVPPRIGTSSGGGGGHGTIASLYYPHQHFPHHPYHASPPAYRGGGGGGGGEGSAFLHYPSWGGRGPSPGRGGPRGGGRRAAAPPPSTAAAAAGTMPRGAAVGGRGGSNTRSTARGRNGIVPPPPPPVAPLYHEGPPLHYHQQQQQQPPPKEETGEGVVATTQQQQRDNPLSSQHNDGDQQQERGDVVVAADHHEEEEPPPSSPRQQDVELVALSHHKRKGGDKDDTKMVTTATSNEEEDDDYKTAGADAAVGMVPSIGGDDEELLEDEEEEEEEDEDYGERTTQTTTQQEQSPLPPSPTKKSKKPKRIRRVPHHTGHGPFAGGGLLFPLGGGGPHDRHHSYEQQQQQQGSFFPPHHAAATAEAGLLPEDTYSLLAFVNTPVTLLLSWAALGVQCATLTLLALDVMDFQDSIRDDPLDYEPDNPLGIPASVSGEVATAQLLALVITLISESNVLWSLNVFLNGFDRDLIVRLLLAGERDLGSVEKSLLIPAPDGISEKKVIQNDENDDANGNLSDPGCDFLRFRWIMASSLRLIVGLASLTATFVLIVRSDTVLEILLNFTAIEFISKIDNAVFVLAKWGHFGLQPQRDADQPIIDEFNFTIRHDQRTEHGRFIFWNGVVRLILYMIFLGGWLLIFTQQGRGRYQASSLFLQMGDTIDLELATYTGIYRRSDRQDGSSRRFKYENILGRGELKWCREETAWVFVDPEDLEPNRPCGWKVVSSPDFSFDILRIANEPWFLDVQFNIRTPIQQFQLTSHSSKPRDGARDCPPGTFGWNCEYSDPCPILAINEATEPFQGDTTFAKEFRLLDPHLSVYSRPVYMGEVDGIPNVIIFLGRRWFLITTLNDIAANQGISVSSDEVVEFFTDLTIHDLSDPLLGINFVSEPVDVGTPLDAVTPVGLQWFRTNNVRKGELLELAISEDVSVASRLICGACVVDADCQFNGICVDGSCDCPIGARGLTCEVSPVGNGYCNPQTNSKLFDFDGGDCCLSTCSVDQEFACGRDALGYADTSNTLCKDTRITGFDSPSSELTSPNTFEFGRSVALNDDGTRIAIASVDTLVSYFTLGRGWIAESTATEGVAGFSLSLSQNVRGSSNNPLAPAEGNSIIGGREGLSNSNLILSLSCGRNVCRYEDFVINATSPPLEYLTLPDPPQAMSHPRLLPFPLAAAISPDGKFLLKGGFEPEIWIWDTQLDFWVKIFRWKSSSYILYASISSTLLRIEDGMLEFTLAVGMKDFASYPDRVDQPLEISVFHFRGIATMESTVLEQTQVGSNFSTDYHMLRVSNYLLSVPGDFFTNGEFAGTAVLGDAPVLVMPEKSLLLSRDAKVLAISSFFVVESDIHYNDVYGGRSATTVDPQVESAFLESLHGQVAVYEFQDSDWVVRDTIDLGPFGLEAIEQGWRIDLSLAGDVLLVGTREVITGYVWDRPTRTYFALGQIPSAPGVTFSMSADGLTLAVGYPLEGLNGVVRIFRNDVTIPCPPEKPLFMRVSFTTGTNTRNTYFEVVGVESGVSHEQDGPAFLDNHASDFTRNMTFTYNICFPKLQCSSFVVSSDSDNVSHEGTASVFFNRTVVPWKNSSEASTDDADCEVVIHW